MLARDLGRLEQATTRQLEIQRVLASELPAKSSDSFSFSMKSGSAWSADDDRIREVALRVLHLGRVQHGLLARARRRLRAIAHLRAGTETGYACRDGASELVRVAAHSRPEEGSPCPA